MPTIKDIVQKGRCDLRDSFYSSYKGIVSDEQIEKSIAWFESHIDSRIIEVLEYSHKEIENIDISIMTYGAFRRQVLSLITSFIDEIKK